MGKRGKIKIVIFVNQLIETTISVFFLILLFRNQRVQ